MNIIIEESPPRPRIPRHIFLMRRGDPIRKEEWVLLLHQANDQFVVCQQDGSTVERSRKEGDVFYEKGEEERQRQSQGTNVDGGYSSASGCRLDCRPDSPSWYTRTVTPSTRKLHLFEDHVCRHIFLFATLHFSDIATQVQFYFPKI